MPPALHYFVANSIYEKMAKDFIVAVGDSPFDIWDNEGVQFLFKK
jgi:hypothetical protein